MLKIIKNPDKEIYEQVRKAVTENSGYCPCELIKNDDTKCPCKAFREQTTIGECHCGLYCKIEVEE
ncbi:MAG: hypothetical protein II304_07775 [Bacteroidales bacterium]|nr:hypothetical protein [Bacteroidales bacterium]